MAQYYAIYDWERFPVQYIAILACGLPDDSRTKRAMNQKPIDSLTWFLGSIVDALNVMIYQNSLGKMDKPQSIVEKMLSQKNEEQNSPVTFNSAEEFLLYRQKYVKDE